MVSAPGPVSKRDMRLLGAQDRVASGRSQVGEMPKSGQAKRATRSMRSRWIPYCLLVTASAISGCEPEVICPPRFSAGKWCDRTGACTLDGAPADCLGGRCRLHAGKRLAVPIRDFFPELGPRRTIALLVVGALLPFDVTIRVDGTTPKEVPQPTDDHGERTFLLPEMSAPPEELTFEYTDDEPPFLHLLIDLIHADCERAHPPEEVNL